MDTTSRDGRPYEQTSGRCRKATPPLGPVAPLVAILLLATPAPSPGQQVDVADRVQERIRLHLESGTQPPGTGEESALRTAGERLHAFPRLREFYEGRVYRPAWSGAQGGVRPEARPLLEGLRSAPAHGLRPEDYHATKIESLLAGLAAGDERSGAAHRRLAELDLLLTDAFLTYGAHLLAGRVDPRTIDPLWTATARGTDLPAVLQRALGEGTVRSALDELSPAQPEYRILRRTLAEYRSVAAGGGWPQVPPGPTLREGDSGERVAAISRRLAASGDLSGEAADSAAGAGVFDEQVAAAVRRFQHRHGLETDAVVGDVTRAALNVSVSRRIEQLELNMERWRWMPERLGDRYVRVNIASFETEVVEGDSTVLSMRSIVGRHYRQTPVFSDTIRYVVLNPSWNVPHSIAVNDILPQVKESPSYLARQGMQVYRGWGSDAGPLDPATVDWADLGPQSFPYRFVQRPGPLNALGRVKFMFPNRFSVYLHDTPARGLFRQNIRGFSSGCVRLERPLDLLDYLYRGSEGRTPAELRKALETKREQTVRLPTPIPVHLQYWTAWAEEDGTVHFRRDLYGRDARLEKALASPPPEG